MNIEDLQLAEYELSPEAKKLSRLERTLLALAQILDKRGSPVTEDDVRLLMICTDPSLDDASHH